MYSILGILIVFGAMLIMCAIGARMLRIDEVLKMQKDILDELKKRRWEA